MFSINDLLKLEPILNESKIHLATGNNDNFEAFRAFIDGEFKQWQDYQNRKNFTKPYIISLILYKPDVWLFAGVFKTLGMPEFKDKHYQYKTEITDIGKDLVGRLLIHYKRTSRQSYLYTETVTGIWKFHAILEESGVVDRYPGNRNVTINFDVLEKIINNHSETWKAALSVLKGIYIISDNKTKQLYIGSASGTDNVWGRWSTYAKNGHGYNVRLIEITGDQGLEYARQNFTFSLIEFYGDEVDKNYVLERESLWKRRLFTRDLGYNKN
ncbi:protein containing [Bacteroidales bacterium 6E]|nr:protein containing [Bacteroidales bacterium 6E]